MRSLRCGAGRPQPDAYDRFVPAPVVAVPTYHLASGRVSKWLAGGYAVPEAYVNALARAGVAAALLPAAQPIGVEGIDLDVLDRFDGILLVGGGDVDPSAYGAPADPHNYGIEADRDTQELALARAAVDRGLPLLAVCRGMQLLNVAFGGTLHQHLPDVPGLLPHGVPAGGPPGLHDVRVEPGSRLGQVVGDRGAVVACTSFHHQGVDVIGDGLVATGWTEDGLVEALETPPGDSWVLAVQWHPEMTAHDDPAQQAIFDEFAAQIRARAHVR
jgi:putative glutamine amidotransferase